MPYLLCVRNSFLTSKCLLEIDSYLAALLILIKILWCSRQLILRLRCLRRRTLTIAEIRFVFSMAERYVLHDQTICPFRREYQQRIRHKNYCVYAVTPSAISPALASRFFFFFFFRSGSAVSSSGSALTSSMGTSRGSLFTFLRFFFFSDFCEAKYS
ncbi:hypothetical protein RvY_02266 [Ramazzottius varieornatus]|uniref:Uncharacterized protein n=1 Tax=Ramazzottius varieornatus TaxID=947166 RepID=A0A1D1UMW7_RAMVA|nr:hypothetical protein RvY_02266 [Ramazzottius varieornatus]